MNFKGKIKENHGITLVSLIVAIIILLILAGVVLSLAVGEDGIIKKSITSSKQYDISTAKEQVEMLAATYASNYYEEKHLSGNEVPEKIGDYVLEKLETESSIGDYRLYIVDGRVIVRKDEDFASAKIEDDGAIIWDRYPFDPNEITIGDAVDSDRYGDKVDYVSKYEEDSGTTLGWRLFYKDNNYAYIICDKLVGEYRPSDYYANKERYQDGSKVSVIGKKLNPILLKVGKHFKETYNQPNIKANAWFTDTDFWKDYEDKEGKALYAIASPTLDLFLASFNATASENNTSIVTLNMGSVGSYGYDNPITIPTNGLQASYNNEIYRKSETSISWWLASPSTGNNRSQKIIYNKTGKFGENSVDNSSLPVRPIVCLPAAEITDSMFINEE